MTHHTDAKRAEFEAWYEADAMPAEADWFAREKDEPSEYKHADTASAWRGWQAARRAPAAPVPQDAEKLRQLNFLLDRLLECAEEAKEDCARAKQMMGRGPEKHCVQSALEISHSIKRRLEDVKRLLAAAPQPPEAAPVQMPEYGIDTANHAGIRVRGYTEQQVRELLAAHGIKVSP